VRRAASAIHGISPIRARSTYAIDPPSAARKRRPPHSALCWSIVAAVSAPFSRSVVVELMPPSGPEK
jgi:hypothetical protein